MWTATFWKRALERAIQAAASAALAILGGEGIGLLEVDWGQLFGVVGLAFISSVLQSLVSTRVGSANNPSLVE